MKTKVDEIISILNQKKDILSKADMDEKTLKNNMLCIYKIIPSDKKSKIKLLNALIDRLIISINEGEPIILGLSRVIFLSDFENTILSVRKIGLFRSSNYKYKTANLNKILKDSAILSVLLQDEIRYFKNIETLLQLAPDIHNLQNKIEFFLNSNQGCLKHILALAEIEFYDMLNSDDSNDGFFYDKKSINKLNKEDWLSAISYTLMVYKEQKITIASDKSVMIDEQGIQKNYKKIFKWAHLINAYKQVELKVDFFSHDVLLNNKKQISIVNEEFDIAESLGFSKAVIRRDNILKETCKENSQAVSFQSMMDDLWKKNKHLLYNILTIPFERIVVPFIITPKVFKENFINTNSLFLDEIYMLNVLATDNYNIEFTNHKIFNEFTVFDIFKIQRFFYYISYIYHNACKDVRIKRPKDVAEKIRERSVLPVIKTDKLARIFSHILGKEELACIELIKKISIDFESDLSFIDVQYYPIIKMGDASVIIPTVGSQSNLIRSIALNTTHLSIINKDDMMIKKVKEALEKQNFEVETDFEFGGSDVDVVCYSEGKLFLFECKNPFLPVNDYELRNTYSHIEKAINQLQKLNHKLKDKHVLKQFIKKLNFKRSEVNEIYYGIINANNALSGYSCNGFKVFNANELIYFLSSGLVETTEGKFSAWKNDVFSVNDLINYLQNDIISSTYKENKIKIITKYNFGKNNMVIYRYVFKLFFILESIKKKFRKVE